jgi:phospholipid transport system substrate-binding protein
MEPMKRKTRLRCTMMACCFFLGMVQSDLFAETPRQVLQETIDRLQNILRDPDLGEDTRTEQVREIVVARFDFREMSKRMLGSHWEQNVEKQDEFVAAFTEFMKRTFFNKVDKIKDTKVICRDEELQGSTAKVITIIHMSGEEFKIKFKMQRFGTGWKIYDVLLDNDSFSILRSYRVQFLWILQGLSFEELLHIIRAKNV